MKLEQALLKIKQNSKKNNGYLKSVRFADSYHLYRQSYCGCVYSYQDMLKRKKDVEDDGTNL